MLPTYNATRQYDNNLSFTTPSTSLSFNKHFTHEVKKLTTSDIILIIVYVVIFTFGLLGNFLVIRYFGFQRKSKLLYHIYLIHLAVADLISATITPVHFAYGVITGNIWHLGPTSCTIVSVIGPLTVNVSAWLLASIAHERYRGIVNPFKPRLTKLRIHVTVGFIWFISIITLIPYMYAMELNVGKYCIPKWKDSRYELISAIGTLVLQSILPIGFMIYTVSKILIVLKNRMRMHSFKDKKKASTCNVSGTSRMLEDDVSELNNHHSNGPPGQNTYKSFRQLKRNSFRRSFRKSFRRNTSSSTTQCQGLVREKNISQLGRFVSHESPRTLFQYRMPENSRRNSAPDRTSPVLYSSPENQCEISEHINNSIQFKRVKNVVKAFKKNISKDIFKKSDFELSKSFLSLPEDSSQRIMSLDTGLNFYTKSKSLTNKMKTPKSDINIQRERIKKRSVYNAFKKFISLENKRATKNNSKQRERITMLVVTFSVFVVCSLPYNIFYVIVIVLLDILKYDVQMKLLSDLNFWLSTLVVANSITNCCIYAGMDIGFRRYCYDLIVCNKKIVKDSLLLEKRKTRTQVESMTEC